VVRDLKMLGLSVAIGFCVWLGGSLLAEQVAQPTASRQLLSDRVELAAPNQTIDDAAPDLWVDLPETAISHDRY
jgi:hypothetical protein